MAIIHAFNKDQGFIERRSDQNGCWGCHFCGNSASHRRMAITRICVRFPVWAKWSRIYWTPERSERSCTERVGHVTLRQSWIYGGSSTAFLCVSGLVQGTAPSWADVLAELYYMQRRLTLGIAKGNSMAFAPWTCYWHGRLSSKDILVVRDSRTTAPEHMTTHEAPAVESHVVNVDGNVTGAPVTKDGWLYRMARHLGLSSPGGS